MDRPLPLSFLSPFQRPTAHESEDLAIWEPSVDRPNPPPLPSQPANISVRGITAKQYNEVSLLAAARAAIDKTAKASLLPTDLPGVTKAMAKTMATISDSGEEEVVTSGKLRTRKRARLSTAEPGAEKEAEDMEKARQKDLESMLEETLMEAMEEEEEHRLEENVIESPSKRRGRGNKGAHSNVVHPLCADICLDLSADPGIGSLQQRAIQVALKTVGSESWEAFSRQLYSSLDATGDENKPATTRRRGRSKKKQPGETLDAKPTDVLNPNSRLYHQQFANAYNKARQALQQQDKAKLKAAADMETQNAPLDIQWSDLTPAEHSWYLERQGKALKGAEAQRFQNLHARVVDEQKEYRANLESIAMLEHRHRYDYMTERQNAQIQEDVKQRRARIVQRLPRYYEYHSSISLRETAITNDKSTGDSNHYEVQVVERQGSPPVLGPIPINTTLPGSKLYLPATVSQGTKSSGAVDTYRKVDVPEIWEDEDCRGNTTASGSSVKHVVAAGGAVSTIMASRMLQNALDWEIPLVIADKIYLGKPLLARKERLRDQQRRLYKYAALTYSIVRNDKTGNDSGVAPREKTVSKLQIQGRRGGVEVYVRSHERVLVHTPIVDQKDQDNKTTSAVFKLSTNYLQEPDCEAHTAEELVKTWCCLSLVPDASVALFARVHVPTGRITAWEQWSKTDLEDEVGNEVDKGQGIAALQHIVQSLYADAEMKEGKYLLSHKAGSDYVALFKATEDKEEIDMTRTIELPLGGGEEKQGEIHYFYDLHAAAATFGGIDASASPYNPPIWRPYRPEIPQIPSTFPPQLRAGGRKGVGSKGPRRGQRRSGWQGDVDRVGHIATLSRAEYQAGIEEEL